MSDDNFVVDYIMLTIRGSKSFNYVGINCNYFNGYKKENDLARDDSNVNYLSKFQRKRAGHWSLTSQN